LCSIKSNKVVVLLGPTAVGKTSLISQLSGLVHAVIYADSAAFYNGCSIASAKPTPDEQAFLPHYLISFLNLNESYNATQFTLDADRLCQQFHSNKQIPLVSGGSLFYLNSFLFGPSLAPPASSMVRAYLQNFLQTKGAAALYTLAQQIDPVATSKLHPNDNYRLLRLLEVYYSSGRPLSSFTLSSKLRQNYKFIIIILERERDELYRRINDRVEAMFVAGLAEEVAGLKALGLTAQTAVMRTIGYAEWFIPDININQIKELIKQNSRRYAKRQLTFLRKLSPYAHTFRADDCKGVKNFLAKELIDD
jgi:tRNA dimethylallyltransferase